MMTTDAQRQTTALFEIARQLRIKNRKVADEVVAMWEKENGNAAA